MRLIAHHIVNDPAPILAVLLTESDCRDYIASDIDPIFAASPSLRGVLGEPGKGEAARLPASDRILRSSTPALDCFR